MRTTQELQLVTPEQAKRLQAAGFSWRTPYCYAADVDHRNQPTNTLAHALHWVRGGTLIPAPTVAIALKWMREVKKLFGCVDFALAGFYKGYCYSYFNFNDKSKRGKSKITYCSYEAAESALLDELLNR
jgi:hypothetical protein